MPALYCAPLGAFVATDRERLLGVLTHGLAQEGFDTTTSNTFSWHQEIQDLQEAFRELASRAPDAESWAVLLEYVLPVVGLRIDCILLAGDIIYVIEYKGGASTTSRAALQQAQDYASNLADFHEESRKHMAIPIALGHFKTEIGKNETVPTHGAAVSPTGLPALILEIQQACANRVAPLDPDRWQNSRYFPVPTIIEAASAIYEDHDVKDLAFSRSGTDNLGKTQLAIINAIRDARQRQTKTLILVTGVPGAGKTLAGLNAVQTLTRTLDLSTEQAGFLSGNAPLVKVLQTALKRSAGSAARGRARSVNSRIREMHRFVRDTYADDRPPANRLIVFDEAQRAWTAQRNLKLFGRDASEPEMILDIMGRHEGWAAVVALVGGGQEIHAGEAGLAAWGEALRTRLNWEVLTSPEALDGGTSVAGSRLFRAAPPESLVCTSHPDLHLAISKRSFETEVTAAWVNAFLRSDNHLAASLATKGLPIFVTRDIARARRWLRQGAVGRKRAGLVASSGAVRLRAEGVEAPSFDFMRGVDYVRWFLEPAGDYRSSNQLEVAMSEFEMQGLELDLVGLIWGGDLVYRSGRLMARRLRGLKWEQAPPTTLDSADDLSSRIMNKYRVLLTRFRKGMVIVVPRGSSEDQTRSEEDFNGIYNYLLACGVPQIEQF